MYNDTLTLLEYNIVDRDKIGQAIYGKPVETIILCRETDVGMNETYMAASSDFRPDLKLIVHEFEYDGQKYARYQGEEYKIFRVYRNRANKRYTNVGHDEIELTLERVIGHV